MRIWLVATVYVLHVKYANRQLDGKNEASQSALLKVVSEFTERVLNEWQRVGTADGTCLNLKGVSLKEDLLTDIFHFTCNLQHTTFQQSLVHLWKLHTARRTPNQKLALKVVLFMYIAVLFAVLESEPGHSY